MASPPVTSHSFCTTNCGLMISSEFLNTMHLRLRHSSTCFHHAASASGLGRASPDSIWRIISSSTSLTSPTMGTSTFTRLEIDDGSMSMWMILRGSSAKCAGLPITRSSKRAPTASSTSE